MTPRRRLRIALISSVAAVLAVAGWYGWWLAVGTLARQVLDDWSAAERARGGTVTIGALAAGGFPFGLNLDARGVEVARRDGSGWRTDRLLATAPLWWPRTLTLRPVGLQRLSLPGGQQATAASAEGRLTLGGASGFTEGWLSLSAVTLPAAGTAADRLELSLQLPSRLPANGSETGLTIAASVEGLHLAAPGLPLGPLVERASFAGRLQGAPPRPDPAALTAWSHAGGSLAIDAAQLRWGPVTVDTSGALELDRDLQPTGSLATSVAGFGPAVDALAAAGWLRPKDVHGIKAVLTGLSPRREGGDGKPVAKLPISLHDRFVHVGPFRLVPLPAVVWLGAQWVPNQTTEAPPAIRQ
ncbi:MAG: DUF2125 domain-containing protein [Rhodospirillaceae bacterium]